MVKCRAFISFDYDNDLKIKNSLIAQAKDKDSPFNIVDVSIKETIDSKWKVAARENIKQSDIVIFICGHHTDAASGVSAEMSITQEEEKPYFLLKGYKKGDVKPPRGARSDDEIHEWKWKSLKSLISR
ncbi:MAG TPA: hypothetical protein VJY42_00275 [Candidatus Methanomethylophilaceae archaeon]|nr:hypothetical protein [Candidatus Methanomethylophilaceae archaeon]